MMAEISSGKRLFPLLAVVLAAILISFALRAYRLEEIHYKFDEWLGTLQPGPAVSLTGGLLPAVKQIHTTAQYYVTSTMTVTTCVLMQLLKMVTGPDLAVASLGVGMTAGIAARREGPGSSFTWSVILMGSFSATAIIFSQFANNFALTFLLTPVQVCVYLTMVRGEWRWPGFLLFSLVAYFCQLVMYTQLVITAGLYLAALVEIAANRRRGRRFLA